MLTRLARQTILIFCFFTLLFSISSAHTIKWSYPTAQTYASVIVDDKNIYSVTAAGTVYAFDKISGRRLWTKNLGSPVFVTPLKTGDTLYIATSDGIVSMDENGVLKGSYSSEEPIVTSPLSYEGMLIAVDYNGTLYLFDASKELSEEGLVRKVRLDGQTESSTVAFNGRIYVILSDGRIISINPLTGAKVQIGVMNESVPHANPIIVNNSIVFTAENKIAMVRGGSTIWERELPAWLSAPTYKEGMVFTGSNDGSLYVLNAQNGDLLWDFHTNDSIRHAPVMTNYTIYLASNDKYIYAIAFDGSLKWKAALDDWPSTPSISEGIIYTVTYNGTVAAISTLGCTITVPKENGTIAAHALLSGGAYADSGIKQVEVRTVPGDWKAATATGETWAFDTIVSGFAEGTLPFHCRVADDEGNVEIQPYTVRGVYFVFAEERLPQIIATAPERVDAGETFTVKFYDELNNSFEGVNVPYKDTNYKADENGEIVLTASSVEGEIALEASAPNYRTVTINIMVGKSPLLIALYIGLAIIIVIGAIYIYMKSRAWH